MYINFDIGKVSNHTLSLSHSISMLLPLFLSPLTPPTLTHIDTYTALTPACGCRVDTEPFKAATDTIIKHSHPLCSDTHLNTPALAPLAPSRPPLPTLPFLSSFVSPSSPIPTSHIWVLLLVPLERHAPVLLPRRVFLVSEFVLSSRCLSSLCERAC